MNKARNFVVAALTSLVLSLAFGSSLPSWAKGNDYHPPEITSASPISYPPNTLAAGIVSFALHLDARGKVQSVDVTRDFPPLTKPALAAVRDWTFSPATLHDDPIPSTISVSVIFNVYDPGGLKWKEIAITPPAAISPDQFQFKPADLTSTSFANYPPNTLSYGTVVLDVTVSSGGPERTRAVLGKPPLTTAAIQTVESWSFLPATFKERPITSHLVVAFVLQINNPVASPVN